MKIKAAVLWERGAPLSVEDVELDPPGPGEVLVEVRAAGVCHSDLHPARGEWPTRTPVVLGHEGAGIVRDVGPRVTRVKTGDHVVFCWAPACGICPSCVGGHATLCDRLDRTTYKNRLPSGSSPLKARGLSIGQFLSTACFADHVVVAQEGAVVVGSEEGDDEEPSVPFEALAMVGCAVVTGVGAVLNAARVPAGATVAVLGAGGVGLNVVQGAVLAGAGSIIAIDRHRSPLDLALELGATDVIPVASDAGQPVADQPAAASALMEAIRELTSGRGVDFVFDTVGTATTLSNALGAVRKGGTVVLTGLSRIDTMGNVPMFPFVMQEKKLIGSVYGSGRPTEDIQRLVGWHREGHLRLRELVSRTYSLSQINEALAALEQGGSGRGIVIPASKVG